MKRRELSGIYFRIGNENVDWLDMSLEDRVKIIGTKDAEFLIKMIAILRDVHDEITETVFKEMSHWPPIPQDKDQVIDELENITTKCRLLGEKYDLSRVEK